MKHLSIWTLFVLTIINPSQGEITVPESSVSIQLYESGNEFFKRNDLSDRGKIEQQPAGMNFYTVRWNIEALGTVIVDHGQHSFEIPHVLGLTGDEDHAPSNAGIKHFSVRSGISKDAFIMHDEARILVATFLKSLVDKGWKPVITYENPRLSGEEAFRYYEEVTYYNLPADYTPTLEEWMRITRAYWQFYADDVILKIQLMRDRKFMNVDAPGAYFLAFTIYDKEELGKAFVSPADRSRWQELWVENIKKLKRIRYAKERELEERGFTIFTEYEEPMIHPEDPVEP